MRVAYIVNIDEQETTYSKKQLLDMGLEALASVYSKTGAYFDVGYNPEWVTNSKVS